MSKDKSTGGRGAAWDRPKRVVKTAKKNYRLCCLIATKKLAERTKKLEKALKKLK